MESAGRIRRPTKAKSITRFHRLGQSVPALRGLGTSDARGIAVYMAVLRTVRFGRRILTDREREVFQLAAEGNSSPAISERLHISPRTVEMHRANLMRKLGLRNQTELVRYAVRRGIITAE